MPDLITEKIRRARKDHVCTGCRGQIKAGDLYHRASWYDDGMHQTKLCAQCYYVWQVFIEDDWGEGDLAEDHQWIPADVDVIGRLSAHGGHRLAKLLEV